MSMYVLLVILICFVTLGSITLYRYRAQPGMKVRKILFYIFLALVVLFLIWLAIMVFVVGPSMSQMNTLPE
jgi:hypothetical protein